MKFFACPIPLCSCKQTVDAVVIGSLAAAVLASCVGCSYFRSPETTSKPWIQNYEGYSTNHTMLTPGTVLYGK